MVLENRSDGRQSPLHFHLVRQFNKEWSTAPSQEYKVFSHLTLVPLVRWPQVTLKLVYDVY